jgi:ATP-dependent RNA helicase DeaD
VSSLTFDQLNLKPELLKVLTEMNFTIPTDIQQQAIPVLTTSDKNFVGQAQTGTGKTAAFVIPLLEKIDPSKVSVQALILTPTRELAFQVESEIQKLGKYLNLKSTCIYGGTSYDKQILALKKDKPQIVVGTPGRVIDMIKKKILNLDRTRFCVLDEADEMLNMGFAEDVQTILDRFKSERQLMMFSATMPKTILKMIKKSFNDHHFVKVENKSLSNDDIEQKYFIVREKHFKEGLARLIDNAPKMYGIVFCRTKLETKSVGDDLKKRGHLVEVLNGDMGQTERDHAMKSFKDGKVKIMVCTDVAARGIDVQNLTHVFNYGLPRDNESYVHRIGRTGRAGMKGKAYTIVGPNSAFIIRSLEKHINKTIKLSKLPSVEDLKRKVVESEIEGAQYILEAIKNKGADFKTEASFELFESEFKHLNKEELLKLVFVWKFNKVMRRYNNLADIEDVAKKGSNSSRTRDPRSRKPRDGANTHQKSRSKPGLKPKQSSGRKSSYRSRKS